MHYLYLTRRGDLVVELEKGSLRLRRPNLRIWGKPMLLKSICKGTQLTTLFGTKLHTFLLTEFSVKLQCNFDKMGTI